MADVKISALPAAAGVTADDLVPIVNDPGGTPATQKATAAQLLAYIAANSPTPSAVVSFYEDFIFGIQGMNVSNSGTATSATNASAAAVDLGGHPGQCVLDCGTDTTGRASLTSGIGVNQLLLGNGAVVIEADVYLLDALSDGTDSYTLLLGLSDGTTTAGNDAVCFRYTHSVNGGRWQAVTRSNGAETASDTGVAVASTTWYKLRAEINAAATSVTFFINGASVATIATNIPSGSGRQTVPRFAIVKSAGTNARRLAIDYILFQNTLTVAR